MSSLPIDVQGTPPGDPSTTPAAEQPLRQLEQLLGETIPPLIAQAREAFRRDLPELLSKYPRKWVAYSGDQRLGIAPSKTQLYQECLRHGLTPAQFLILSIEPEVPADVALPPDV
jgi:hypothetical protein